jgi:twitching motility two-component system response regulator PilH
MTTILVVEDSRLMRTVAEKDLAKAGYRVITAADGQHALQSARQCTPDLILLDMLLPKLTGLYVLRALKTDELTKHIPVIVLTSLSKGNADKLMNEGAAAFFEKSDQAFRDSSARLIQLIGSVLAGAKE